MPPNHPSIACISELFKAGRTFSELGSTLVEKGNELKFLKEIVDKMRQFVPSGNPVMSPLLFAVGEIHTVIGMHKEALAYFDEGLKIQRNSLPVDHPSIATSLKLIGEVYIELGCIYKALVAFKEALDIQIKNKDESRETAEIITNIGKVYMQQGYNAKALSTFEAASKLGKSDDEYKPTIISYIGRVYERLGDHQKANEFYSKANSLIQEIESREHSLLDQNTKHKLFEEAESCLLTTLQIQCGSLSPYHFEVGFSHMGVLQLKQGLYEQAMGHFSSALEFSRRKKPVHHTGTAAILLQRFWAYKLLDSEEKASDSLDEALSVCKQAPHSDTYAAKLLDEIGSVFYRQKEHLKALEIFNEAVDRMRTFARNENDRHILATILRHSAKAYCELGATYEALACFKEAYGIKKMSLPFDPLFIAKGLIFLGNKRLEKGLDKEAENYLEEAVNMCRQHDFNTLLSIALYYRGKLYLKQSYFNTAMASFQEALQIQKELDLKQMYTNIQTFIGYVYARQGRLDKAVETYMDNIDTLKRLTPCGDYLNITKLLCCIAKYYIFLEQKEEALNIYCYVLNIRMDVLPKDHADIRELCKIIEHLVNKK